MEAGRTWHRLLTSLLASANYHHNLALSQTNFDVGVFPTPHPSYGVAEQQTLHLLITVLRNSLQAPYMFEYL